MKIIPSGLHTPHYYKASIFFMFTFSASIYRHEAWDSMEVALAEGERGENSTLRLTNRAVRPSEVHAYAHIGVK